MSHATVPSRGRFPQLAESNITLPRTAAGGLSKGLAAVGGLVCLAMLGMTFGGDGTHALAAYHVGAMSILAMCLGCTFFVMIFRLMNAGWTAVLRRQFENVMCMLPYAFAMVAAGLLVDLVHQGSLFRFMNPANHADYLLNKKWIYFFGVTFSEEKHGHGFNIPLFWLARAVVFGAFWTFISRKLMAYSRAEDQDGSPEHAAKARFTSAWGILLLALTTAFAGFDWLMSLDYRFFSTMWGVYVFAGGAFSGVALVILTMAILRGKGKLDGAVTSEHFHDLGKILFSFTVFWAYIAFSQYFLIWYSNIPEETVFFIWRKQNFTGLSILLIVGHFFLPFLILIFRPIKKNPKAMAVMACWALFIHVIDLLWIVRPAVYTELNANDPGWSKAYLDVAGVLGPAALFAGLFIKQVASGPLVAANDPFMHEALEHKNYV